MCHAVRSLEPSRSPGESLWSLHRSSLSWRSLLGSWSREDQPRQGFQFLTAGFSELENSSCSLEGDQFMHCLLLSQHSTSNHGQLTIACFFLFASVFSGLWALLSMKKMDPCASPCKDHNLQRLKRFLLQSNLQNFYVASPPGNQGWQNVKAKRGNIVACPLEWTGEEKG